MIMYEQLLPDDYIRNELVVYSACYLCGSAELPLEEEHVIPKILFKSIKPNNYIKLKACAKCNREKSKQDEYIGRLLQASSFNEHANHGVAEALRGMKKGHGLGLYADQMSRAQLTPPEGINGVKTSRAYINVPTERMNDFQINVAKGLWTNLNNFIFDWSNYDFITLTRQKAAEPDVVADEFIAAAQNDARYMQNWEGVFKYSGDFKSSELSYWINIYYDSLVTVTVIKRKDISQVTDLYEYIFS